MEVHPRVVHRRRNTITALPLYYSGYLLKKNVGEKNFKKCYGELRGSTIFLYANETELTYMEKLDLEQLKPADLDSPHQKKTPNIFTLTLHDQEVQLKIENETKNVEWRGFILTVAKKEIPAQLKLLPGQIQQLDDVLDQERKRTVPQSRPPLPPRPEFLRETGDTCESSYSMIPSCFYDVSREEAERMLEANPECGSIILRPSALHKNYAVTLRHVTPSGPVMKHYRVTSTSSGFVIELDTAVTVSSLDEVLEYCMQQTEYRLHPYTKAHSYNTRIEMPPAPKWLAGSSTVPELPKEQVATKSTWFQPPTKTAESGYTVSWDHREYQVPLDNELQKILQKRKENIYKQQEDDRE